MSIAKKIRKKQKLNLGGAVQPLMPLRDEDFQDVSKSAPPVMNDMTKAEPAEVNKKQQEVKGLRKVLLAGAGYKATGEKNTWGKVMSKVPGMNVYSAAGTGVANLAIGKKYDEVNENLKQDAVDTLEGKSKAIGGNLQMAGTILGTYFGGPQAGQLAGTAGKKIGDATGGLAGKGLDSIEAKRMADIQSRIDEDKQFGRGYGASLTASEKKWYEQMSAGIDKQNQSLTDMLYSSGNNELGALSQASGQGLQQYLGAVSNPGSPIGVKNGGLIKKYAKGGIIHGAGTGKSDSINASIEGNSFVVPVEKVGIAKEIKKKVLGKNPNEKAELQDGGTPVKLSNGEMMFTPEETQELLSKGIDVQQLAPNAEPENRMYKKGGLALKCGGKVKKLARGGSPDNNNYLMGNDIPQSKKLQNDLSTVTTEDAPADTRWDFGMDMNTDFKNDTEKKDYTSKAKAKWDGMSAAEKAQLAQAGVGIAQIAYGLKQSAKKEPDLPMFDKSQLSPLEKYKRGLDWKENLGRQKQESTYGFSDAEIAQAKQDIDVTTNTAQRNVGSMGAGTGLANVQRALATRQRAGLDLMASNKQMERQKLREYSSLLGTDESLRGSEVSSENTARLKSDADAKYIDERNTLSKYEKKMDRWLANQEAGKEFNRAGFKNIEGSLASVAQSDALKEMYKAKYGQDYEETLGGFLTKDRTDIAKIIPKGTTLIPNGQKNGGLVKRYRKGGFTNGR